MRWPILARTGLGLLCVQVVLVCLATNDDQLATVPGPRVWILALKDSCGVDPSRCTLCW